MDLSKYNIIDLDSYGIPFNQLEVIFSKRYTGIIFITFVQSRQGALPQKFLLNLGYSLQMIQKIPTLFYRNGFDKFKEYLALNKITEIYYKEIINKYYIKIEC